MGIENITAALAEKTAERLRIDLLHHRGKLLYWSHESEAASRDFDECLKLDAGAYFCDLQLARIKAKAKDEGCRAHVEKILSCFEEDEESVAITIVLAAFSELEKRINAPLQKKWLNEKIDIFRTAIRLATAEGFSQPYRTLGGLGRQIYYEHPKVLIQLSDVVSFPPADEATGRECFEIAECLKSVGKACVEEIGDQFSLVRWLERALEYYARNQAPKCFQLTMLAECLIRLGRFSDALIELDRCEEGAREAHWWHRRAQALLGLTQQHDAIAAINKALELNQNDRYVSAFLQVRAKIEAALGLPQSIVTMKEAIGMADSPKFRDALERDLSEYQGKFL